MIEQYDYEEARACFEEAVRQTGGAPDAIIPLLELLVDHLAAYDDVLALAAALPKAVAQSLDVRTLLALAAARTDRLEQTAQLISGSNDGRLAEVHVALAGAAIRENRFSAARAYIERARELDPGDAGIIERERELKRAEATAMADEERALEDVLAREGHLAIEARARELLRRWPGSKVGRRILGEIDELRRASELESITQQAEEASSLRAFGEAISLWRRAIALGGDAVAIHNKITAAESEEKKNEDEARVSEVLRLLAADDLENGFRAYWLLGPELQAAVRDAQPLPQLIWLSAMTTEVESGRAGRQKAVAAVGDLAQATELYRSGEVAAAARIVLLHPELLATIPEARDILEEVQKRLSETKQDTALSDLNTLRGAVSRGDVNSARRVLEKIDRFSLPDEAQREIEDIDSKTQTAEGTLSGLARLEALLTSGDSVGARNVARDNVKNTDGEEREAWQELADDLAKRVRLEWRQFEVEGPEAEAIGIEEDDDLFSTKTVPAALTSDGNSVLYVRACGTWMFLRVVAVETGSVLRAVALCAPTNLDRVLWVGIDGNVATVTDNNCHLLEINLTTWEIERWYDFRRLFSLGCPINHLNTVPGNRYVWVTNGSTQDPSTNRPKTHVVDLESLRIVNELDYSPYYVDQVSTTPPRLVAIHSEHPEKSEIVVHQERGRPEIKVRIPGVFEMFFVRSMEEGRRYAVLFKRESQNNDPTFNLLVWTPGGRIGEPFPLRDSDCQWRGFIAWSETASLLFVTYLKSLDEAYLSVLRPRGETFVEIRRVTIPVAHRLIWDATQKHVVLVTGSMERIRFAVLDGQAPGMQYAEDEQFPWKSEAINSLLHRTIHEADEASDEGDGEAVVRILDRTLVFKVRDTQTFARLSAAYLKLERLVPSTEYRKALILADCVAGDWRDRKYSREYLGDANWSNERVDEVVREAAAWLSAWRRPDSHYNRRRGDEPRNRLRKLAAQRIVGVNSISGTGKIP